MTEQTTGADTSAQAAPSAATPAPSSPGASPSADPTPSPAPSATARPDYVPEEFWDAEKSAPKVDAMAGKLKELTAAQQAEADRKASLPKTAGDYKIELPADFKMPEGWTLDPADKSWPAFADYAHKNGLSQEQFAQGAKLVTEMRLAEAASRIDAANAEFAKLGDGGRTIVEGVHNFIDANAGSPEAAKAIKASLGNSAIVTFMSSVAKTMVSNGIAAFNGSGRDDGRRADGKPANWDSMSAIDRLTYIRSNQTAA